jgi:hypothetical protein
MTAAKLVRARYWAQYYPRGLTGVVRGSSSILSSFSISRTRSSARVSHATWNFGALE